MLLWGTLSDVFVRQSVSLATLSVLVLGFILYGVANSFSLMLAGRTVQGIGRGGTVSFTTATITDMEQPRARSSFICSC